MKKQILLIAFLFIAFGCEDSVMRSDTGVDTSLGDGADMSLPDVRRVEAADVGPDRDASSDTSCHFPLPKMLNFEGEPSSIQLHDLDSDGCIDIISLIASHITPGQVELVVAWGAQTNAFEERTRWILPGLQELLPNGLGWSRDSSSRVVSIGDWNLDGAMDIATASGVAEGQGAREFLWRELPGGDKQHFRPAIFADLGSGLRLIRGTDKGVIEECDAALTCVALANQFRDCPDNTACETMDMVIADFDGDGQQDVLAGSLPLIAPFANVSLLWLSSKDWESPTELGIDFYGYQVGDINGDGALDIVTQLQEFITDFPSHSVVWINDPTLPSRFQKHQEFTNWDNHTDNAALSDVDGDGCLDYLMIGVDKEGIGLRMGNPKTNGTCTGFLGEHDPTSPGTRFVPAFNSIGIQVLDINNDGIAEWALRDGNGLPLIHLMEPVL